MTINTQWYIGLNGSGSFVSSAQDSHPGIFQLNTGASTNDTAEMLFAWNNGANIMLYPSTPWDMRWVVQPQSLTAANYSFGFGASGNGVYIVYRPVLGPNWIGVLLSSGVETTVDLGVAASTSSWAKLRLRSDGTRIFFSVNGNSEVSICPSGCTTTGTIMNVESISLFGSVTTTGNSSQTLLVDFFALQISGLNR